MPASVRPAASAGAPQLLQDRVPSVGVRLIALCPRMDLVALALDGDTLAIQRLSWQRLATVAPPAPPAGAVSSLAWAPHGDALAVGTATGALRIVRVNPAGGAKGGGGERVGEGVRLRAGVSALQWAEARGERLPAYEPRDRSPGGGGSGGFIVAGDEAGGVTLFSYDLAFRVASFQAFAGAVPVTKLLLPPDLSCVFASGESNGDVKLCRVSLNPVTSCLTELMRAGAESVALLGILSELKGLCKTVGDSWVREGIEPLTAGIVEPLDKLTFDYAEDTDAGAWRTLYNSFCGGGFTSALEQFLAKEMSESGAKELMRAFTAASKDAREALACALPLAERVVFRSSEYRGLARGRKRFADIGVDVPAVDRVFDAAEEVLSTLGLVQEVMDEADAQTCAFLRWITAAAASADGSAPAERSPDAESAQERSLTTAFFQSVLLDDTEGDCDVIVESVTALFAKLMETLLPELVAAADALLKFPSEQMAYAFTGDPKNFCSECVLTGSSDSAETRPVSMSVREGECGASIFEAATIKDHNELCLARFSPSDPRSDTTKSTPAWIVKRARVEVPTDSISLCAVSHVGWDQFAFVGRASNDGGRKVALSLFTCGAGDFRNGTGEVSESKDMEAINVQGRPAIEFFSASESPSCSLSVERERSLAGILVGARRVLLFDLRSAVIHEEGLAGKDEMDESPG